MCADAAVNLAMAGGTSESKRICRDLCWRYSAATSVGWPAGKASGVHRSSHSIGGAVEKVEGGDAFVIGGAFKHFGMAPIEMPAVQSG
jgi:hypothetical protein